MLFPKKKRVLNPELLKEVREKPCCVCGSRPVDASHIKTRKSGGGDLPFNVVPHCRAHHIEWGSLGAHTFCKKYPIMKHVLKNLGWSFDQYNGLVGPFFGSD